MNIHIKSYGKGTPLVLFHGWGFDHHIWYPLIPLLESRFQLILVDLPGFGLTHLMDGVTFQKKLLACLPQEFILAGWSLGGLYATRLAMEEPRRVVSLLNINSSPCFLQNASWPGVTPEVFAHFYKNLSSDPVKALKEFIALQTRGSLILDSLVQAPSLSGLEFGLSILNQWDLREELKKLVIPCAYFFGRLDPITPVKTMHTMQKLYPKFKYILFNKSAHMPFLSDTELFIKELLEFVS